MFKTLSEVIAHWNKRFQEKPHKLNEITTPGYTPDEITAHEKSLGIEIHPAYRELLQKAKFDTVGLGAFHLSKVWRAGGQLARVEYFQDSLCSLDTVETFFVIGSITDWGYILLDNQTGEVYFCNQINQIPPQKMANNPEQLILIATSIVAWGSFDDREERMQYIRTILDVHNISNGFHIWELMG